MLVNSYSSIPKTIQSERHHLDDVFESTPFKKTKNRISVDLSDSEEKYFKVCYFLLVICHSFPHFLCSLSKGRGATPAKSRQTPQKSPKALLQPVNRDDYDGYINSVKQGTNQHNKATCSSRVGSSWER